MAPLPVASTIETRSWCINSFVPGSATSLRHDTSPAGAPARRAASSTTCAAASEASAARGWGARTTALRALTEMRDLKNTVETGFVVGTSPATTPTGSATSTTPMPGWLDSTPTVVIGAIASYTSVVLNRFFTILWSARP